MNKRASRFCFNIEDFSRVICQPKSSTTIERRKQTWRIISINFMHGIRGPFLESPDN